MRSILRVIAKNDYAPGGTIAPTILAGERRGK